MKTYKVIAITDFNHDLMIMGDDYETQQFLVQADTKEQAESIVKEQAILGEYDNFVGIYYLEVI